MFIFVPAVPCLDEHTVQNRPEPVRLRFSASEVTTVHTFTADTLDRIVDRTNRRGPVPLYLRHNLPGRPRRPVVGYARNFRVGPLGDGSGREAILSDWMIDWKDQDLLNSHRHRSIELSRRGVIEGVALLQDNPNRYLGETCYEPPLPRFHRFSGRRQAVRSLKFRRR
jgi:hypothetical protein